MTTKTPDTAGAAFWQSMAGPPSNPGPDNVPIIAVAKAIEQHRKMIAAWRAAIVDYKQADSDARQAERHDVTAAATAMVNGDKPPAPTRDKAVAAFAVARRNRDAAREAVAQAHRIVTETVEAHRAELDTWAAGTLAAAQDKAREHLDALAGVVPDVERAEALAGWINNPERYSVVPAAVAFINERKPVADVLADIGRRIAPDPNGGR
jgi:hypothetical protein